MEDFSDGGNDFLQNMLEEDRSNSNNDSGGLDADALLREALNRSGTSLGSDVLLKDGEDDVMMDAAFDKSPLFAKSPLKSPEIMNKLLQASGGLPEIGSLAPSSGGGSGGSGNAVWGSAPDNQDSQPSSFGQQQNFFSSQGNKPLNATLDASPLNLLLGRGGGGMPSNNNNIGNNNNFGNNNNNFNNNLNNNLNNLNNNNNNLNNNNNNSNNPFGGGSGGLTSNSSFGMGFGNSMLRKNSNNNLVNAKFGSVIKASRSSNKMRSHKSDGLLARAFKQKYNSNSQLNKMNNNGEVTMSAQIPRNAISSFGPAMGNPGGPTPTFGNAINQDGQTPGAQNASWGAPAASSNSTKESPFSKFLAENSSGRKNDTSMMQTNNQMMQANNQMMQNNNQMMQNNNQPKPDGFGTVRFSTNSATSKSSSTMQDALRMYKKQSKTQSALRQSSQSSLRKHSQSVATFGKTNIESLLPPQHTSGFKSFGTGGGNHNFSFNLNRNTPDNTLPLQKKADAPSLLHQSCRLYPTTAAVVESALRVDPDAVRKPITPVLEKGQAKKVQNTYGYPLNIALSHGGSLEVLKMLAEAAPEILLEKDGTDGSRSLGIAVMAKNDWSIISMLLRTNVKCIQVADRRGNYPLHIAANHGLSLGIVKKLYRLFPKALQMRNFHSETPLDIAQRSTRCSEEVMNFLQAAAFSGLESAANHMQTLEMEDVMETNL
eukprot:CAMPEP_0113652884 /NCGR_PEP_ID=MMETSP0017_2-20120614/28263_1 /TAXON_ID=2856 /ORGANISM="Cylindrotheca closterium" /LENGTH=711 /DNA_ID=CAMNT_0000565799 /DNA_START=167 /DNA_END=2302 /DNA_ORIENTATION=- /assembly_acc=CAM_ASM_000147